MFKNLKDTIVKLNADVSDLANQKKAKKLRSKLIKWGGVCIAIGLLGVIGCFIAFVLIGVNSVNSLSFGFPMEILAPMFLIIPSGILVGVGGILLKLGLGILIAGATTKFVDNAVNRRCECGYSFKTNEKFCPKCGKPAIKTCSKCNKANDLNDEYCSNCGQKL